MTTRRMLTIAAVLPLIVFATAISAFAQTSVFTYQGRLTDSGTPANGSYDLQFALFDSAGAGTQIGSTQTAANISVSAGVFTVPLDFGAAALSGADRFLEISVRLAGGGAFTTLSSRQQITSTPYAVRSANATTADVATNAQQLGGVAAAEYTQTNDPRLSDARAPTAGSSNYVQNTTGQQASASFNVSGNGTAGGTLKGDTVSAVTQYNLGNLRVLSAAGGANTFVGIGTGENNTGTSNAFFGTGSGFANTTGSGNSFFGSQAGDNNTTGFGNSFFGRSAGGLNIDGNANSFFGDQTGLSNTSGSNNSFFGNSAGNVNTTGASNSFFGYLSGQNNTAGNGNSFFGVSAGQLATGSLNSFFGLTAGLHTTTGEQNSFFGNAAGYFNTEGFGNAFFGSGAGQSNTTANGNSFFGSAAGSNTTGGEAPVPYTTASGNSFFGESAGSSNTSGANNTIIGGLADVGSSNLNHATAIGAEAVVNTSNTIVLGRSDGSDVVLVPGLLTIPNLAGGASTQLCLNSFNRVGTCGSSLRYKTNLAPYRSGLSVVNRLRPISFTWKEGGMRDLGFGAEDVEKIDPLLVTYNKAGQVEGVKYDRINVVLVNALKEQQQQIQAQQRKNEEQQRQIESLKRLVCLSHPKAAICK